MEDFAKINRIKSCLFLREEMLIICIDCSRHGWEGKNEKRNEYETLLCVYCEIKEPLTTRH